MKLQNNKVMKKLLLVLSVIGMISLQSCEGPAGPPGRDGYNIEAEVFELRNVNFGFSSQFGYSIYQELNPPILNSDVILIYRMAGTINSSTPIWEQIPRTLYLNEGELDFDFDFSRVDFTIYAGGTYNLALTPQYLNNQTFRIVIIPGYFGNSFRVDYSDYESVMNMLELTENDVKILE